MLMTRRLNACASIIASWPNRRPATSTRCWTNTSASWSRRLETSIRQSRNAADSRAATRAPLHRRDGARRKLAGSPNRRQAMGKQGAKATLARQRKIQSETDRADRRRGARKSGAAARKKAAQTAPRKYPRNPLPAQHQQKPGDERA